MCWYVSVIVEECTCVNTVSMMGHKIVDGRCSYQEADTTVFLMVLIMIYKCSRDGKSVLEASGLGVLWL